MKLTEAINILRTHQQWRTGAEIEQLHPSQITESINVILALFEERYTKQEFFDAAEAAEVCMIDAKHIISYLDELKNKTK
jgi:hypothetical protein